MDNVRGDDVTTGEKLALLRRQKGMTQEELSETLNVSRQSVSRWEMDAAFPETDKLIRLSKLFDCSIDFLLKHEYQKNERKDTDLSATDCLQFIRECGYFFLATSVDDQPRLRPFGMIHAKDQALFIATDKRKSVYSDLQRNPQVEVASYRPDTRKWIRIRATVEEDSSMQTREEMMDLYSNLRQAYRNEDEMYLVIYRLLIDHACIT